MEKLKEEYEILKSNLLKRAEEYGRALQAFSDGWNDTRQSAMILRNVEEEKLDLWITQNFTPKNDVKEGQLFIVDEGELKNIKELPKEKYEKFLEEMNRLQALYVTLTQRTPDIKTKE